MSDIAHRYEAPRHVTVTPGQLADWRSHTGRTQTLYDQLGVEPMRRFAAATGAALDVERRPPPLAHWAFFLEARGGDALGVDGHPIRGGFLPAVDLPRRMFAAATIRFLAPLLVGEPGALRMTVADVRHHRGRSGDLVFIDVERSLSQAGTDRVSERQTIAYRGVGSPVDQVRPDPGASFADAWQPGPVELFRFSAVTFNAHRIHYDLPYARGEEGYPGLVVHGPLTATKLCAFAAATRPGVMMRSFAFRAAAPLFAGQPVRLRPGVTPGVFEALRCDGVVAMMAEAAFA